MVNITIDNKRIEQISSFKYLGSVISENRRCILDVKTRIAIAKDALNRRKVFNKGI